MDARVSPDGRVLARALSSSSSCRPARSRGSATPTTRAGCSTWSASVGLSGAKRVADETLCVWTLADGRSRLVKLPADAGGVAIARLAMKVTVAGKEGGLSLLDLSAGTTRVLEPHTRYAGATPSDDGKLAVAWTREGGLHVYDDQGQRVRELVAPPGARVRGFSPRNLELLTLDENVAVVWDLASGRQRRFISARSVLADAFLRDASGIVTGDAAGILSVWPLGLERQRRRRRRAAASLPARRRPADGRQGRAAALARGEIPRRGGRRAQAARWRERAAWSRPASPAAR